MVKILLSAGMRGAVMKQYGNIRTERKYKNSVQSMLNNVSIIDLHKGDFTE